MDGIIFSFFSLELLFFNEIFWWFQIFLTIFYFLTILVFVLFCFGCERFIFDIKKRWKKIWFTITFFFCSPSFFFLFSKYWRQKKKKILHQNSNIKVHFFDLVDLKFISNLSIFFKKNFQMKIVMNPMKQILL